MIGERPFDKSGVGALMPTPDGRYLMQLRDRLPGVSLPGYWGLFGGIIENNEEPFAALLRELREELSYEPAHPPAYFTELAWDLRFAERGVDRKVLFEVPIDDNVLQHMHLGEGEAMRLLSLEELLHQKSVVPWDLLAVVMHSRRESLRGGLRRS